VGQRPVALLLVTPVLACRPQEEDDPDDDPERRHDRAQNEDRGHTGILPQRRCPKRRDALLRPVGPLGEQCLAERPKLGPRPGRHLEDGEPVTGRERRDLEQAGDRRLEPVCVASWWALRSVSASSRTSASLSRMPARSTSRYAWPIAAAIAE
jgi:hypothetical protein